MSEFDFTADYGRFPYPVSVKGGTFDYEDKKIVVEGLSVAAGKLKSSISSATYEWKDNSYFNVSSSDTTVDLGEFYPWLSSLDSLKTRLKDIGRLGDCFFQDARILGLRFEPGGLEDKRGRESVGGEPDLAGFSDRITLTRRRYHIDPRPAVGVECRRVVQDSTMI